ncbi:hypothetical protein L210DRAFT_3644130 [Boletus edulis BED1]|uniref:Uncharacterized protein n=1 Tax=Boletus edulis BED1 TaxID=1328754 RepID=A0AAD4GH47_BOLED|nr:hypothetical protein L210DRAFT_3644130 [Boletus edulis BED1]
MDPSIPRQQSSVSRALSTYNMSFWSPMFPWDASASEILSEEASEEIGQSTDSVVWGPSFWMRSASEILSEEASEDTISNPPYWYSFGQWNASTSEILNEEALETGQSADGF